jgi:threonine dehydrogenase-like Zn-dependent dehydrogenase
MRELVLAAPNRLEWHERAEPRLQTPHEVLVRPFAAARCDADIGLIRGNAARGFRIGAWLRQLDPDVPRLFGHRPYAPPFPIGHECVAEVLSCGEAVRQFRRGDVVVVPFQVSCGACATCSTGLSAHCESVPPFSMYGGVGGKSGAWGGAVSDCLRVPYGDAMLVAVPPGVDAAAIASASDNLPDGWRAVAPALMHTPRARVLVLGGAIKSIGLYAAAIAVALGAERVDFFDRDAKRLEIAASIGAHPMDGSFIRTRALPHHYPIVVDATNDKRGLALALRSTSAGGVCTTVGIFPRRETGIPMLRMYSHALTLRTGVSSARPSIPALLELVRSGRLRPELVTTLSADWEQAAEAFATSSVKVVVTRPRTLGAEGNR